MTKADPSPSHRQSPAGAAADRHDEYSEQILSPPFSGGPCPLEPAASMCSGGAKLSQPGGVHISAVSALRSQSQDGDCQADPAGEGNEPNSTWRRMSGLNISAEPPYGDVTVPQSPTGGQSSPIRQPAHWPPRSPATAGGARKRTSPKKSVSPPKKAGAWSPIRGRHSRRPPPLLLSPRSSTTDKGMARGSTEGEKALQEWQRAMKSPSPSKWRASDAVMQLEADTIALAAGAVTAMLAANAAAAGPLDSPKKVVRRTWDWLAEQPEDAAELAVLLFEAAPKLKISASGSGGTSRPPKASRRASYKEEDGSRHRLSAAVPCPTGPGDIDWKQLAMVIGSESLKFEAEHNAASKAGQPGADDASHMFASPRGGDLVEVNSGGHVMFCFLSGPRSRNHHHGSDHAPCQPQQSASQSSPAAEQQQHRSGTQQQQSPQQSQPGSANKLTEARGHAAVGQRAGSETGEQLSAAPQLLDTLLEAPLSEQPPLPPHREAHRPPESCTGPAQGDALDCNANKDQSQPSGSLPGGTEGSTGAGAGRSPGAACSGRSSPCSSIRGGSRSPSPASSEHAPERVVIVKVHQARLASQSEQFANELTQHLGICTPACRILRRMDATAGEWKKAHGAAMLLRRRGEGPEGLPVPEEHTLNSEHKAACDDKGATAGEWKEAHGAAMLLGRRGND
ncbi:g7630 [Coccomyxa elongata]